MKKCFVASFILAMAGLIDPALAGQPGSAAAPKGMQLFLLIGQSNMAGRGKVAPQDREVHPRIFMLNAKQQWVPAQDPVHFDKSVAGVGLCSEFARHVVKKDPKVIVGLIPCAFGGTKLSEWMPGSRLYSNALARTQVAMQSGTLVGILWHQGESDSGDSKLVQTYNERFAGMIARLRKDLNAEKVPVIVGELCNKNKFNQVVQATPELVPLCDWASSEGCANDGLHFKREGYLLLGKRYAEKYFKLSARASEKAGAP